VKLRQIHHAQVNSTQSMVLLRCVNVNDGTIAQHVWSLFRRYQEKWYFTPGDTGFKVFKTKFATIGVLICWDQVKGLCICIAFVMKSQRSTAAAVPRMCHSLDIRLLTPHHFVGNDHDLSLMHSGSPREQGRWPCKGQRCAAWCMTKALIASL